MLPAFLALSVALPLSVVAPAVTSSASAGTSSRSGQTVVDWQRVAVRTIYTEGLQPAPVGSLYLGFTSLAMNDAVKTALSRRHANPNAAAAAAAHGVLTEYFPASTANLDSALEATLSQVPDGYAETKGVRIGEASAAAMIASRADDGRGDASVIYSVPTPTPVGVWAPPSTGMLAPWLGFVDPLVIGSRVAVDGPDPLGSKAYAADLNEVQRIGSATSSVRTQEQTDIALFFTANPVSQLTLALCSYLETHPIGLARTARLFAVSGASIADSLIQAWHAKFEYRFWRPFQAIARAGEDGNRRTTADATWIPLVNPNPPYPEYFSGHGSVVSSFAQSVRRALGDDTPLVLVGATTTRSYATLSDLEAEAFMARIWAGLHFRDAMHDAYMVGRVTANRVRYSLASQCPYTRMGSR
jgi:hypothetical protein